MEVFFFRRHGNHRSGSPPTVICESPLRRPMQPITRRILNRSQTAASSGLVPLDGDRRVNRSHSASAGSLLPPSSSASTSSHPNLICVESKSGTHSLESSSAGRKGVKMTLCRTPSCSERHVFKVLEYLHMCNVDIDTTLLCSRGIRYVISCGRSRSLKRSTSFECLPVETPVIFEFDLDQDAPPQAGFSYAYKHCIFIYNYNTFSSFTNYRRLQKLVNKFSEVNQVIAEARQKASQVMIIDPRRRLGTTLAIQHIMWYYELDVERALGHWRKVSGSKEGLTPNCMHSLTLWQKSLVCSGDVTQWERKHG
ncbi:unnamed protein product [Caenorhabditis auriculariae]|uniref:Tyrosine-protein phosphatase domain-containing protein n=1 Tax=Caenorhabditis auriculariae TaxID=2777116 RepID=A0A8S1H9M1_9PELO|nr:unnamed protein product [Caenorhabditis auriculariae]